MQQNKKVALLGDEYSRMEYYPPRRATWKVPSRGRCHEREEV